MTGAPISLSILKASILFIVLYLIIRKKNNIVDALFMDSYYNDLEIYDRFIKDMTDITSEYNRWSSDLNNGMDIDNHPKIKCPLCRTEINKESIRNVKGSSDKCKVCLETDVTIYFEECEHACVCSDCFKKL